MKINILLDNPTRTGELADTKLSFEDIDGTARTVDLNISFQSLWDFSNDTTSVSFDLFFISALVYGIDNLLERYQYSVDAWARDIEVCFPVNNLDVWNRNQADLEPLLSFLTGDYWAISFEKIIVVPLYTAKAKRWKSKLINYTPENYSFSSLFSGGLDSLVGVIDGITNLNPNQKALLLSHFDSTSPGANGDQERIDQYLGNTVMARGKFDWIQCVVALSNYDSNRVSLTKESSFRSRSFLFIGIGTFCVERLANCDVLTIPENGTISLNFPLTPSRTSTLSTRTTHPYYIENLQKLLVNIGLTTKLFNPYHTQTKGELVERCLDPATLNQTYALSVSCGKRGRKVHWDTRSGTHHCGVCMPCLYRRAALHKLDLDTQLYGIDIFTTPNEIFHKYDFPALFYFLNSPLTSEQIKRTLLVAGSVPDSDLDNAAILVENVRIEIKQWLNDKGNDSLKKLAGIE